MATRTAVFVEDGGLGLPAPIGSLHLEVWRVDTATAGDTSAIAPKRGRFIQSAIGVPHNLSPSGNATNVTITLAGPSDLLLLVQE
jgi:hypothetical protein